MEKTSKRGSTSNGDRRVDRVEWIAGAVSAVLVLSMLGYLIMLGVRGSNADPELEVIEVPGSAGQMRFAVLNRGGRTASSVTVALQLATDTGAPEQRSLTIDFVPAHSQGAAYVSQNSRPASSLPSEPNSTRNTPHRSTLSRGRPNPAFPAVLSLDPAAPRGCPT